MRRVHLESQARNATQSLAVPHDFVRNLLWTTDQKCARWTPLRFKMFAPNGRPTPFFTNFSERFGVAWIEIIDGFLGRFCDISEQKVRHNP